MEENRKLTTIRTISKIAPIDSADSIETVYIDGWTCVVRKDENFKEGEKVFYFEVDSMLPIDNPLFAHLAERGTKVQNGITYHRLKTARLKGQYSQGLVMKIPKGFQFTIDDRDYSEEFGVVKYIEPIPFELAGKVKPFPNWINKTDEERIQNIPEMLEFVKKSDKNHWIATQKIDGTSTTYYMTTDYKFGVCSRNLENIDENSTPWKIAEQLNLKEIMTKWVDLHKMNLILQGELFGEKIQGNPTGIKNYDWLCFNVSYYDETTKKTYLLPYLEATTDDNLSKIKFVPTYDIQLLDSIEENLEQVETLKNRVENGDKSRGIEGVVWKHKFVSEIEINGKMYKPSFKVISNKYLLKHE